MFEKASRLKLRFNYKGQCTVEDLWDVPLTHLDNLFRSLNTVAKAQKEESLLTVRTKEDSLVDLQIEIVKYIVSVRLKEAEEKEQKRHNSEKKKKILEILAEKQDKSLYEKSDEELKKLLDELD